MYHIRSIERFLEQYHTENFLVISGPGRVGKTKIAQRHLQKIGGAYFSWEDAADREAIFKETPHDKSTVVLDGFQSYDRWKIFSAHAEETFQPREIKKILLGNLRHETTPADEPQTAAVLKSFELHPFTAGEFESETVVTPDLLAEPTEPSKVYDQLWQFGGFPEPFFKQDEAFLKAWQVKQRDQFVKQVIPELTEIKLNHSVEHLMILLPQLVGSPLSVNALSKKLSVGFNTVKSWIDTLENLFFTFQLKPYREGVSRSIKKETKVYMMDWSLVENKSARFENMVAGHLWKAVTYWRQCGYGNYGLYYIRDRSRREIDFCITKDEIPVLLVDAKLGDDHPIDFLNISSKRHSCPAIQLLHEKGIALKKSPVAILSADRWLKRLP